MTHTRISSLMDMNVLQVTLSDNISTLSGPNRSRTAGGGYHPLPQFEVPPDPSPDWSVKGLTYAVTHGADSLGERRISPPRPPLLFSVSRGERRFPLPPTPTSLSLKMSIISSKQLETYSHPKSQLSRSEFRKDFCKMSFDRGSGETCSPKVSPETEPMGTKPKVGLEGGLRFNHFHPPDCGGATSVHHYVGNSAPPLASERSERARGGVSEVPEE